MTKLTKKVALSLAIATLNGEAPTTEFTTAEIVGKLTEMVEQLEKKSGGEKKLTEQQVQNIGYKSDILAYLADGKPKTATEILNGVSTFEGTNMTNQRVSALLRQLYLDGKVKKDTVKGKTLFSIVEGE